jgi:N-glycosylase/DNA lyase
LRFTGADGSLAIEADGKLSAADAKQARRIATRVFRLDDDLSPFYARIAHDPEMVWAIGAGRLLASPTVFEDVVKTICTTNCSWSATTRMVGALVELGEGAFPDAEQLAKTPERWFADVARMGYRGPYIRSVAREVARGELDLDALLPARARDPVAVEETLLQLPGVGPYAAAHIMQLLGYHHRLVLDSWTRPKFLTLTKKKRAADSTIVRAFARYGPYAGLAFWLFLTKDWLT